MIKKSTMVTVLLIFLLINTQSFAETFMVGFSAGSIVTTQADTGVHNSRICDACNGAWHCTICHVSHSANGDFDRVPICNCSSLVQTVPTSYKDTAKYSCRTYASSYKHSCGNASGMQQQSITCTRNYEEYTPIVSKCTHSGLCDTHKVTESQHNKQWWETWTTRIECSNCGGYDKLNCKEKKSSCDHKIVCGDGKTSGQHPHNGKTVTGSKTINCSICGGYSQLICSKSDGCHTEGLCSRHSATYGAHPINCYTASGTRKTCSTCSKTYYTNVSCDGGTETPDTEDPPTEGGTSEHVCTWTWEHICGYDYDYSYGSWGRTNCYNINDRNLDLNETTGKLSFSLMDNFNLSLVNHSFRHVDTYKRDYQYSSCCRSGLDKGTSCCNVTELRQSGCGASGPSGSGTESKSEIKNFLSRSDLSTADLTSISNVNDKKNVTGSWISMGDFRIEDFNEYSLKTDILPYAEIVATEVFTEEYKSFIRSGHNISFEPQESKTRLYVELIPGGRPDPPIINPPNGDSGSYGLSVIAVRDLRWQNEYKNNIVYKIPTNDEVIVKKNNYDNSDKIKMGYAVDFSFITQNFDLENCNLIIKPSFVDSSGNNIANSALTGYSQDIINKYTSPIIITSADKNSISGNGEFLKRAKYLDESKDIVQWNWVYYLPPEIKANSNDIITVKFDIEINAGGKKFNYIDYISKNNTSPWKGKVFKYTTINTLYEDLDNNLTY